MDWNGAGTSLFQGTELLNFDVLMQRDEEEEAIEDQKKREEELKNLLENAFDDVSFDNEDCSQILANIIQHDSHSPQVKSKLPNGSLHDIVDASGGGPGGDAPSLHYKHCYKTSPSGEIKTHTLNTDEVKKLNQQYQEADYNSVEQLQILYEVRVREVHRLTELLDSMRNKYEVEKSEWKRQIALTLAEKERALTSQGLLIASKQQIDDLEKEVETLKKTLQIVEKEKEDMGMEIETSKATVIDLQRKVLVLEKGSQNRSETLQQEMNLRLLNEKHNAEQKQILNELENYKKNLEEKVKENEQLKYKISEINHASDEILTKKSEIISRLSKQIEETQNQCEKLMKSSVVEDNIKLQMEMKVLKEENERLNIKLGDLEKTLSDQENELKHYESIKKLNAFDENTLEDGSKNKDADYGELNAKLRGELYRALNSQKAKRQEINNLHSMLKEKDEKIILMKEKERTYLAEAAKFREEASKQIEELKSFQEVSLIKTTENKKLQRMLEETQTESLDSRRKAQAECQELEKENESLKIEISTLESQLNEDKTKTISKCNEEFMKFHNEGLRRVRQETEETFKLELQKKDMQIESLEKEIEEVKNLYVEVFNAKEELLKVLEKEKNTSGRSSVDLDGVKRLQKELEKSRQRILELDQTLREQYQHEVEKLNNDIKHLHLEIEKAKKEKEHIMIDNEQLVIESELLKTEVDQITSEKNLYFLNCERLTKDIEDLKETLESIKSSTKDEISNYKEKHSRELQEVKFKYDIQIKKLNKEIELMLLKTISIESKYSPTKNSKSIKNVGTQGSPTVETKATSPLLKFSTQEACTSPLSETKKENRSKMKVRSKDTSMLTDPEPKQILKSEVFKMMEELGERHEDEMKDMEVKYRFELAKLEKKFQMDVDRCREEVKRELTFYYTTEMEKIEEKHRIEMENRIKQEKKEAVVALITEWACEVQGLQKSCSEAQAEIQKIRAKYKTAKNVALHYKTYFKNKSEHMKEERKRIEGIYEKALRELEKKVLVLVDVNEDEVKAKVESITKLYEQKINKIKDKLANMKTD